MPEQKRRNNRMQIKKADLLKIAVKKEQYPDEPPDKKVPEIAFAGRSNVGKSSLLNLLTNRKKLARTSSSPGKTRTINFYTINDDEFRIVDLPGYGYAKVSKNESSKWGAMIEGYLKNRENLIAVILLVDIRHKPTAQDVQMYEWIRYYGYSGVVVATKADKISRNEMSRNLKEIRSTLDLDSEDIVIPVSALKKTGMTELINELGYLLEE